jgi:hypothetical protein
VKANKKSEAGQMPSEALLTAMSKYNEELMKAGILVDLSGLKPSSKGARVKFSGEKRTVIDGPFAETKELIGGFWIIKANSLDEAISWAKRAPNPTENDEGEIEIRPFFEVEDFAPSPAIDSAIELGKELAKSKKQAQ